jgi:hypothetical protein
MSIMLLKLLLPGYLLTLNQSKSAICYLKPFCREQRKYLIDYWTVLNEQAPKNVAFFLSLK